MKYLEPPQFVICVNNKENPASLEVRMLYRVVEPQPGDPKDYVRIVDETGEDYLYPSVWLPAIELSGDVIEALLSGNKANAA